MHNDILNEMVEAKNEHQKLEIELVHAESDLRNSVRELDLESLDSETAIDIHTKREKVSCILTSIQEVDINLSIINQRLGNSKANDLLPIEVVSELIHLNLV